MNINIQIAEAQLNHLKSRILKACGLSFESYREKTLIEGLKTRMTKTDLVSVDDYISFLSSHPEEMDRLVEYLTVNETYFFREPAHLNLIVQKLIPDLLTERSAKSMDERIKILSAGCSTGEEPYSIAMMLTERFGSEYAKKFSIVGIDIDSSVIDKATKGIYGRHSFRGIEGRHIDRFFEGIGGGAYRIKDELRSMVSFKTMNLCSDNYPEFMQNADIILYRNVSIYFPAKIQEEIFGRLSDGLKSGGYMVVSATETLHHNIGILSLLELEGLFVYRKVAATEPEDRRLSRRMAKTEFSRPDRLQPFDRPQAFKKRIIPELRPILMPNIRPEKKKEDSRKLFDDALELIRAGRQNSALPILEKAIEIDPSFTNAHAMMASILLNMHRFDDARNSCEKALRADRLCVASILLLGIIAHHQGDNDNCLKRLREAVYLDPGCWPAHFYLAEIAHIIGESKRAAAAYRSALEILEKETSAERDARFFPLVFNVAQFKAVCRHKLGMTKNGTEAVAH